MIGESLVAAQENLDNWASFVIEGALIRPIHRSKFTMPRICSALIAGTMIVI